MGSAGIEEDEIAALELVDLILYSVLDEPFDEELELLARLRRSQLWRSLIRRKCDQCTHDAATQIRYEQLDSRVRRVSAQCDAMAVRRNDTVFSGDFKECMDVNVEGAGNRAQRREGRIAHPILETTEQSNAHRTGLGKLC